MRKKTTRIKRLNVNEVELIANMQRNLSAYEGFIVSLYTCIVKKEENVVCLLHNTPLDKAMAEIWQCVTKHLEEAKK